MLRGAIAILFLILLGTVLYAATLRGIPGNPAASSFKNNLDQATKPFELSPERGRYVMTMSMGDFGRFDLPQELADAAYPDVGVFRDRYYIFFAPGISILALPLYLLGKSYGLAQVGAFATIAVFSVFNLIILYFIGRKIFKFPVLYAIIAPLVFGFSSSAWSYATTLYQHQVTTFLVMSGFFAVWKYAQGKRFSWMWGVYVWMCYGLAILIDYPNIFLMLPVMIYFFINSFFVEFKKETLKINARVAFVFTSVLFVAISGFHAYFNYSNFGDWKKVSGSIVGVKYLREIEISSEGEQKNEKIKEAEEGKNPIGFFDEHNIPFSLYTITISQDRGLFFYYPVYILSLFGLYAVIRKGINKEIGTLLGIAGASIFLYSSWGDPWGGWAFGARYMILVSAVLSLFVAYWMSVTRFRLISRMTLLVAFGFSAGVALLGALTTNAVPPQVEGDFLKMKSNFMLNYDYLMSGRSSSFVYNTYVHNTINLFDYYVILYWVVMTTMLVVLVSSYFGKRYADKS